MRTGKRSTLVVYGFNCSQQECVLRKIMLFEGNLQTSPAPGKSLANVNVFALHDGVHSPGAANGWKAGDPVYRVAVACCFLMHTSIVTLLKISKAGQVQSKIS
jgi:hypothetical protein